MIQHMVPRSGEGRQGKPIGMTPDEFFESFVEMDFHDWRYQDPQDVRRAFHLAVSTFHMADHYFEYYKQRDPTFRARYPKIDAFRDVLTQRAPRFAVVRGMANAYKHLYTSEFHEVPSGGAVRGIVGTNLTVEGAQDQAWGALVVRTRRHGDVLFEIAITEVLDMWRTIMTGVQPSL
jgi:hypothetical protein